MSVQLDIKLDEKIEKKLAEPPMFKVILLNDNVTPIEFVIELLKQVFRHTDKTAEQITLSIHNEGSGVAGVYNYEIAEMKAVEATNLSRASGFPLSIKVEVE